jgi:predicted  nucleic acid-binding Zn-ribbon protein
LDKLNTGFEKLNTNYTEFNTKLADLKKAVSGNTIELAEFKILSSASEVANDDYNFLLNSPFTP